MMKLKKEFMKIDISPDDILDLKETSCKISESLAEQIVGLPAHLAFGALSMAVTQILLSIGNFCECQEGIVKNFQILMDTSEKMLREMYDHEN